MNKKNLLRVSFALAAVALIGGGVIAVNAASSTSENNFNQKRSGNRLDASQLEAREERQAQREFVQPAVLAALEAGDYNAWQAAVGENNPFQDKITAENFDKFTEAHNLKMEAKSIMTELGIEGSRDCGQQMGAKQGRGAHRMMR